MKRALGLLLRVLIATLLSALFAYGVSHWETQKAKTQELNRSLRLARQIATQAEGLTLAAKEFNEADPLRWAADFFGQGHEPRVLKVSKFSIDPGRSAPAFHEGEAFHPDWDSLLFDYSKLTLPEDGLGFKISIRMEPVGPLGARGKFQSDARTLALAILLFPVFGVLLIRRSPTENRETGVVHWTVSWLSDLKGQLIQLGTQIREMVREAQNMALAAQKSRTHVTELRQRIHNGINQIRELRGKSNDLAISGAKAETIALNLVIEASKLGDKGKRLGPMAEELHRFVQSLRKQGENAHQVAEGVEKEIEPISTDADLAFHSFDDLGIAANGLDRSIRKSTESLLNQAKLIQGAKTHLLESSQDPDTKR